MTRPSWVSDHAMFENIIHDVRRHYGADGGMTKCGRTFHWDEADEDSRTWAEAKASLEPVNCLDCIGRGDDVR